MKYKYSIMYVQSFYNLICNCNKSLLAVIFNIEPNFCFFRKIKYIYNSVSGLKDTQLPKSNFNPFTSRKLDPISKYNILGINTTLGFYPLMYFLGIINNVIFTIILLLPINLIFVF